MSRRILSRRSADALRLVRRSADDRRVLAPGERVIGSSVFYSSAWLDPGEPAASAPAAGRGRAKGPLTPAADRSLRRPDAPDERRVFGLR